MIDPSQSPAREDIPIEQGRVYVLCEGVDEAAMVRELASAERLDLTAGICGFRRNFRIEIKAFADNAVRLRPRAFGIVVDKERNGTAAETSLRGHLGNAGLSLPASYGEVMPEAKAGTDLRLGYFLNPDSADAGAIEQLFVDQITEGLRPCVEQFVACVEATGEWTPRKSPDVLRDKVRLRVYLAAKQDGGNTGINSALRAKHLNVDTPAFDGLKDFLRRLCA